MGIRPQYKTFILAFLVLTIHSSCGFKVSSDGSRAGNIISGVISPLVGLIAEDSHRYISIAFPSAVATACGSPVYAKLFKLNDDGSINEDEPLITQLVGTDAKYTFNLGKVGISKLSTNVQFLVKAEGCNGDVYKRPITNADSSQNIDIKTTLVAETVNAQDLVATKLNQANRVEVESLIKSIDGSNLAVAINSLTADTQNINKFRSIFGVSPDVIQSSRPEVAVNRPNMNLSELQSFNFFAQSFHIDPIYNFAYKWKLDGVVQSSNSSWSYIPSANSQGTHQVDVYVGKNDGSGNIDTSRPYYVKTFLVTVENNILPTAPNFSLNAANPTPVNSNTVSVDLATGASHANCKTFSHLAITDSSSTPDNSQFTIDCTTSGTQTESVTFSGGDGSKTLYLWAIDNGGNISTPKTVSLVLDTLPPVANINFSSSIVRGGSSVAVTLSGSDSGAGISSLELFLSTNGGTTYSLLTNLSHSATSYALTVPTIDTANAKLKLVATDLTTSTTVAYSNLFEIDSIAPSVLTFSRTSNATSISTTVNLSATCSADYDKVLYSQTASTPSLTDAGWEICNASKNYTVNNGDGLKTIYSFTKDLAGNISAASNVTMTLDTTPPLAPAITLVSAGNSNSTATAFTVASCLDRSEILISESMLAPTVSDPSWQTCSTGTGAMTYTLIGPVLQGTHDLYVYAKDAVGNISLSTASSMIYDTTIPALNLSTTLASLYKGGDSLSLNFTGSDTNGLSLLKLYYANDGVTYSLVNNLATNATSYTWTVPSDNTATAKLKLVASDNTTPANTNTVFTTTFTIDSSAPTAPVIARSSSQYSSSNLVGINTTCDGDYSQIIYSQTSTTPSLADANWETCAATKNFTVSAGDGAKTIYAFTRDLAGNISASSTVSMTLDTTLPALALSSFNSGGFYAGAGLYNISWSASDSNLAATPISLSYSTDGTNYTAIATSIANSGTYAWTLPLLDSGSVTLKITVTDLAGNVRNVTSSNFEIDSTAPVLSTFGLASGVATVNTPIVSTQVTASDERSGLYQMRISETSGYSNDSWQLYSATTGSYTLSMTPGSKTVYMWVRDNAGNVSNRLSTNISLDFGNPPTLAITGPSNAVTFATNDIVSISWSCSSTTGLGTHPIKSISYTTNNGLNFTSIASNLANNDSSTTGHYDWSLPAGLASTAFRLWIQCESASGAQIEKLSDVYQTGGTWKIWAGQLSAKRDGILAYGASKMMLNPMSTAAIDSSGNLYYTTASSTATTGNIVALMRVNATTGIIEKVVGDYATSSGAAGEDLTIAPLSARKIVHRNTETAVILGTSVDRSEVLFLDNSNTAKIYGIKADNSIRLYSSFSSYVQTKQYYRQQYFLSKNRILFIFNSGKLYRVDLTAPGNAPQWIYGTGPGNAAVNITPGTEGTLAPLKASGTGGTNNTECSDCLVISSADGNRIWVGGGYGTAPAFTGTNTWAQLDRNLSDGKYYVTAENISNMRTMNNASATDFDDKIYARQRDLNNTIKVFNPETSTYSPNILIDGFNGLTGSFRYNFFSSLTNLYMLSDSQKIDIFSNDLTSATLIAGSNANKVGDGQDNKAVDFINLNSIDFDSTSKLLAISQGFNFRFYNYSETTPLFFSSKRSSVSTTRFSIQKGGATIAGRSGSSYNSNSITIDLANKQDTASATLVQNGHSGGTVYAASWDYELQAGIPDGTAFFDGGRFFALTSGTTGAGINAYLTHSNGNYYFQAYSTTNNYSYLYMVKSSDSKIYKVAGKTGAAGYSVTDSGTLALGSQLSTSVKFLYEIRSGAYAGDILMIDGNILRRISISTESASPKIYDILNLTQASNYSVSTVLDHVYYDESSEISGVIGTGTFYYVRTSPTLEIHKWKADNSSISAATDTKYTLTGLTLSGTYRLALTPDGLLVSENSQNRILRLPP